jgi:hypothetical protein
MGFYKRSREHRKNIVKLMQQGKTRVQAADEVFKGNSNKARSLKIYKKQGLFPYGKVDPLFMTEQSSNVVPEANQTLSQATLVDTNDSLRTDKIEEVIDMTLEARVKALEDRLNCSASIVKLRPKLKRSIGDTIPTSFRFPKELVRRAREKAKSDPIGSAGLNALVETLLFEYIGSPDDLLDK